MVVVEAQIDDDDVRPRLLGKAQRVFAQCIAGALGDDHAISFSLESAEQIATRLPSIVYN
nr:hypothetical protein [Caldilinea sp.]